MKATRAAIAVVLVVASASAVLGVGDLAVNAVGFSTLECVQTTLLWIGLGTIAALPAALAAMILSRALARSNSSFVAAAVAWTSIEGAILAGSNSGWFGVPVALALSGVLLIACALLARSAEPLAASRTPCLLVLLVAFPAAAITGWWRPDYDLALGIHGGRRVDAEHPNVVLIVLDTLRADHLGAYGDARGLSPGFDALAQQGTIFEDAFANAPWTVPSHASLFTGLPPRAHGATTLYHRWLDDRFTTLGESLKDRGYRTAMFSANRYLREANLAQGFDLYRPIGERFEGLWIRRALEILGVPEKWADHGAEDGVLAIDGFLSTRGGDDGPLFLFVNFMEPHWRYLPPLSDRRDLLPFDFGVVEATRTSMRTYGPLLMASQHVGGPIDVVLRAMYAAAVRYQDRQLSRLVEILDARLGSNTILVITSDHGENLGEAGRYDHVFAVNDHLVHVPLLVRYPPVFPAGKRVPGLCQLADVPTTIAELVSGARLGEGTIGRSLVPERFEPRSFVVVEGDPYYGHLERMASAAGFQRDVGAFARPLLAIRTREHKLVLQGSGAPRLFDVRTDHDEVVDVLGAQPKVAEELSRELEEWRNGTLPYREVESSRAGSPLSPEVLERLRRMGYTGKDD